MNFLFNKGFFFVVVVVKDGRKRKSILNLKLCYNKKQYSIVAMSRKKN